MDYDKLWLTELEAILFHHAAFLIEYEKPTLKLIIHLKRCNVEGQKNTAKFCKHIQTSSKII